MPSCGDISAVMPRATRSLNWSIVDYLQLVSPDAREKDLYTRVSEVSKGLKTLAKAQDVAVLALCQLSRKVEERKDRRPQISDLRDSGQIEQDADAIVFLYAPEYYLLQEEPSAERDMCARRG
jgi:replicative DNA helicase